MDIIKFDKDSVQKVIGAGLEGIVYLYTDPLGRKTAFKRFKDYYNLDDGIKPVPEKTMINKEKKLQLLSKESCLKDDIELYDLVYENDKFVGFTSKFEPHETFGKYKFERKKLKLEILKKLRKKVEELNKNNIYIGDFSDDNFAFINSKVRLFDIDNYRIDDYDFDLATRYINNFRKNCSHHKYLDNYCFNLYSISFYEGTDLSFVPHDLQYKGLPNKMNTEKNRELRLELLSPNNGYKPDYLIDHMKKIL